MLRFVLAILVCLEVACTRQPPLTDRVGADREEIRSAPLVVAALILKDAPAGAGHPLELRRLKVQVENVLKGNLQPGPAEVYYFALPPDSDEPRPLGLWQPGDRRIFYLRQEAGLLHTACDGRDDCTIPFETGKHNGYRPDPNRPVDYAIAELLLTEGSGVSDEQFAASIERKVPARPVNYVIDRLENLARKSPGRIHQAACKQLRYLDRACTE